MSKPPASTGTTSISFKTTAAFRSNRKASFRSDRVEEATMQEPLRKPELLSEHLPASRESGSETPSTVTSKPAVIPFEARGTSHSTLILRFRESERMLHWSIAVPFTILFVTGMVLMFVYNLPSEGISRQVFVWTHKIGGGLMIFFPLLTAV